MSKIVIGKSSGQSVYLDLDVLLRTRLLIQANSGGGKSWVLRRLAEQLFGKIPVIIIDPEGEFVTLREKYGYVLVGKGGETPADSRSAAMLAHKLLELRASAVCDIYELKPQARHVWVRLFLESLVDAPKNLWRPTIVIVDESHVYCPEKGQGESEAAESMKDLVTRGRKRGFCAIFATQRLAKLSKNASAEMLNRLVGQTFEDNDQERAADLLSVPRSERNEFFRRMRVIEPGNFWALGRAVAKERILVQIGKVETTHPEPGTAAYSAEPPPAPDKVKALLPKLADLPRAAEEQARTVADLKSEVRSLKAQLRSQPTKIETKSIVDSKAINRAIAKRDSVYSRQLDKLSSGLLRISKLAQELAAKDALMTFADPITPSRPILAARNEPPIIKRSAIRTSSNGDESLGKCELSILAALSQHGDCDMNRLALLSGYRKSGGFKNSISKLRMLGYLDGPNTGIMRITTAAPDFSKELPTGRELFNYWLNSPHLGICERAIMEALDGKDDGMTIEEIAEMSEYAISGGFKNSLSRLRTVGVIIGRNTERMKLNDELLQ